MSAFVTLVPAAGRSSRLTKWFFLVALLVIVEPPGIAQRYATDGSVRYEIEIRMDTERHRMHGVQRLRFTNTSSDTLYRVFYHLYFNAFNPNSMMAERNRHLPDPDSRIVPRIFNLGPDELGFHEVGTLTQDGTPLAFEVFDTVLEAPLARPLPPGASSLFEMRFHSQVPLQTRRSGRDNAEGVDYSMTQWYPKLAMYDERGWHADPYVGREFYAPFGTFDVYLTLPAEYVVGATGVLQARTEVGADSLTWHFKAERVHDFAWVADPDYLHDEITGPYGITIHLLYLPDVAERWQQYLRGGAPMLMQFFSDRFGRYPYPQFTVAQGGDGGMEYPMMTLITGRRPPNSLIGVTAHEMAHSWFHGVLGSNEADYAWMDEGFTSYATGEAMAFLTGQNPVVFHRNALESIRHARHYGYLDRLNTPSDWFERNASYGTASYSGGQTVASMLGYVIGDDVLSRFWHHYFEAYKFDHPDPYAVERAAEDVSGLRLDWFFEQWTNTLRPHDYAVTDLQTRRTSDGWINTVRLKRRASTVMPIDLRLTLSDATEQWVNIPLTIMQGHKPVPAAWIVAEPWAWTFPDYTLTVDLPQQVIKAEIDPLGRMVEDHRMNNSSTTFPTRIRFLHPPQPTSFAYGLGWRPQLTYSWTEGVGIGAQMRGRGEYNRFPMRAMATIYTGSTDALIDRLNYDVQAQYPLGRPEAFIALHLDTRRLLGVMENRVGLSKQFGGFFGEGRATHRLALDLIHQDGLDEGYTFDFPLIGSGDVELKWNPRATFTTRLVYTVASGLDQIQAIAELGGTIREDRPRRNSHTNRVSLTAEKGFRLGPFLGSARIGGLVGTEDLIVHKRAIPGSASLETQWRNDAYRSIAATLEEPLETLHFAPFSGLGPVTYLLASDAFRDLLRPQRAFWGATLTLSQPLTNRNPWLTPFQAGLFSGLTTVEDVQDDVRLLADAGVYLNYDLALLPALRRWTAQSDVLSGLKLSFKVPLWVSEPEVWGPDEPALKARWLLGIETGL